MAEQKGESEARVIEEAINWFDRCDRIIKGGRIVSVTVEHLDGTEKVYTVL